MAVFIGKKKNESNYISGFGLIKGYKREVKIADFLVFVHPFINSGMKEDVMAFSWGQF